MVHLPGGTRRRATSVHVGDQDPCKGITRHAGVDSGRHTAVRRSRHNFQGGPLVDDELQITDCLPGFHRQQGGTAEPLRRLPRRSGDLQPVGSRRQTGQNESAVGVHGYGRATVLGAGMMGEAGARTHSPGTGWPVSSSTTVPSIRAGSDNVMRRSVRPTGNCSPSPGPKSRNVQKRARPGGLDPEIRRRIGRQVIEQESAATVRSPGVPVFGPGQEQSPSGPSSRFSRTS